MWDFFGDSEVQDYDFTGPLVKIAVHANCEVQLPMNLWDFTHKFKHTTMFIYYPEAEAHGCRSFTAVMKQLPEVVKQLRELNYPVPRLAIFTCRSDSKYDFGSVDDEYPDDYQFHRIPGVDIAVVGLDAGKQLNSYTNDPESAVLVNPVRDPGPWNTLFETSLWIILKSATYATHLAAAAYAVFQIYISITQYGFRINSRQLVLSTSLLYLLVNGIWQYGELHSNVGYITIYISWAFGNFAYNLLLVIWVRAVQRVEKNKLIYVLYVISALNVILWVILSVFHITAVTTGNSRFFNSGTSIRVTIQPVVAILEASFMLYYGIHLVRRLDSLEGPKGHVDTMRRLTYLCLLSFIGYSFQALSCILISHNGKANVQNFTAKHICYRVSTVVLYGSIFWVLRIRESLDDTRVEITSRKEQHPSTLGSYNFHPSSTFPSTFDPYRRTSRKIQPYHLDEFGINVVPARRPSLMLHSESLPPPHKVNTVPCLIQDESATHQLPLDQPGRSHTCPTSPVAGRQRESSFDTGSYPLLVSGREQLEPSQPPQSIVPK
ncbi:hypothetical protein IWQ61_004634 [Dispira simplex]|nr:hypothetical protein IWQ61_004634 [Dispira simplex]